MNANTKYTVLHRDRKRARGECLYGGCHAEPFKAGLCVTHYDHAQECKQERRLARRSDADLMELRDRYQIALGRIEREIARRAGSS